MGRLSNSLAEGATVATQIAQVFKEAEEGTKVTSGLFPGGIEPTAGSTVRTVMAGGQRAQNGKARQRREAEQFGFGYAEDLIAEYGIDKAPGKVQEAFDKGYISKEEAVRTMLAIGLIADQEPRATKYMSPDGFIGTRRQLRRRKILRERELTRKELEVLTGQFFGAAGHQVARRLGAGRERAVQIADIVNNFFSGADAAVGLKGGAGDQPHNPGQNKLEPE
jgi:hypothetical protein